MIRCLLFTLILFFAIGNGFAQEYKQMMDDPSINFYDVVASGEAYFRTIDKDAKGSGYKQFARWKNNNEYKFYPSGKRDLVDPNFAKNALESYQSRYPEQFATTKMMTGWRELGPNSVDLITGHYAAGIGRIEDVYADPANEQKLYIGSRSGGLWRSVDGGQNWVGGSTDFLPASGVNTLAVNPYNTDHLLVNVRNSRNGTTYGIYESTDGGATLNETAFNPSNLNKGGLGSNFSIQRIIYHPTIANTVFVGTSDGLYKSTDGLATWTEVYDGGQFYTIGFHPTNDQIVYTYNYYFFNNHRDYLLKSTDGGDTFTRTSEIPGNNNAFGEFDISPAAPQNVYYASSSGIYKSSNEGETFTLITNPGVGVGAFGVNDQDETNMITGGIDVFSSDDEGASFNQRSWWSLGSAEHGAGGFQERYDNSDVYVHADLRRVVSVNGTLYLGTDGTVAKSQDNGLTWENIMVDGVGVRENYKLGLSQSNNGVAILGSQDNGTSIYKESGWIEFYGADGMEALIHPLNPDWMISSIQNGGRRRTKDGGFSQDGVTPSGSASGYWEAPIAYDPNHHLTIYDFRDGVRKSEDFGSSYTLQGSPSFSGSMQLAEIAQNNSDIIIVSNGSNIEKSTDQGVTFIDISSGLPSHSIQDIAFDYEDDDRIFVVNASYQDNGEKVYMSEDGGASWQNITYNIGDIPVHTIVIDNDPQKYIYLGTEIGVYAKPLNGNTWTLYNTGMPNTTIEELEINFGANTLKAATWGRGLWEYDLVGRSAYPSIEITTITNQPTDDLPKTSVPQFITSEIEYSGTLTDIYARWSIDNPDFSVEANTLPMTNTSGNIWVTDVPIPDFPEGTDVYFKVFAEGDSGDKSETYKFMYTVKPFEYCTPSVQNGTSDFINLVEIDDAATTLYSNPSGNDGYTVYNNTPIEFIAGESYDLSVSLQFAFTGDQAGAWIDFNRDASFDDIETITMAPYASNVSTGNFTIPLDAVTDEVTRLRVRNSFFNDPQACNFDAGEVEDYMVIIRPSPACSLTSTYNGAWSLGAPTENEKAIFTANYNTSIGNIEACEIEIAVGATVIVSPETYLKAAGNITVNGTLIIEHEGSVLQVDDAAVVTKGAGAVIEVRKTTLDMAPRDFMFASSPMTAETRDGVYGNVVDAATSTIDQAFRVIYLIPENFEADPLVQNYAPYMGAETFLSVDNTFLGNHNASEDIVPGEGLIIYPQDSYIANGVTTSYDFVYTKGTLNNGIVTYPIQYNGTTENNFNLLGNPYPSAIDVRSLIASNPMINEVYFWEHATTPSTTYPGYLGANPSMQDFSMLNLTTGMAAPNKPGSVPSRYIASGQGFAIKADQAAMATTEVTFNNEMRVSGNNNQYRTQSERNLIWLKLSNEQHDLQSKTAIGFLAEASEGMDRGYDSKRMATPISIYTTIKSGEQLGIQGRESFDQEMIIEVGVATAIEEITPYIISLDDIEGVQIDSTPIYLIDFATQTYVNLKEKSYSFTTNAINSSERFALAFKSPENLGVSEQVLFEKRIQLFPNPATDSVTIKTSNDDVIQHLEIYDTNGKHVKQVGFTGSNAQETVDVSGLAKGVYMVKISNGKTSTIKKLVVY
ncbi:T9SS C-terminal target domain-containing protein [Dokdonia sinensis]|uniref:T9SS C-terminal target domain-containing protein n=1 Tax=Dokdonia sinensis TaxID=2479847 RepID=A0A3M0GGM3_9FLAO|nr:T9SS type A sorting domain-containing protein [Dokdonia sinensis]RMB63824.1 T9SS C-terminal target domain-containing protein [Dokdonia sinensis]